MENTNNVLNEKLGAMQNKFMDIRTELINLDAAFDKLIEKAEKEKEAGKTASVSEVLRFGNLTNKVAILSIIFGLAKEEDYKAKKKKSWKFWKKG